PPGVAYQMTRFVGWFVNDVVITREEIRGLMEERLYVNSSPLGTTKLSNWVHGGALCSRTVMSSLLPIPLARRAAATGCAAVQSTAPRFRRWCRPSRSYELGTPHSITSSALASIIAATRTAVRHRTTFDIERTITFKSPGSTPLG